jgi:hypothetical protein
MEEVLNRQFFSNLLALAGDYGTLRMQNQAVIYGGFAFTYLRYACATKIENTTFCYTIAEEDYDEF